MEDGEIPDTGPVLSLDELAAGIPNFPAECTRIHAHAALICLEHHRHPSDCPLVIEGEAAGRYAVVCTLHLTDQIRNYWNDLDEAAEQGAVGLAFLLTRTMGYTVIERARKRTDVDWWLGHEGDLLFQKKARLEVSGILEGETKRLNERLKKKVEQTRQSSSSGLPAYVVVIEFCASWQGGEAMNVTQVNDLHHAAMKFYDQAVAARANGDHTQQSAFLRQAFEKERDAAFLIVNDLSLEPTRSVLLRSAAAFALETGLLREAEKLCAIALAGEPHEEIAEEVREILEEVCRLRACQGRSQKPTENGEERVIVRGVLKYADKTRGEDGVIKVIDDARREFSIVVPERMLNDIVRPLWYQPVVVEGRRGNGLIHLDIIRLASEESNP